MEYNSKNKIVQDILKSSRYLFQCLSHLFFIKTFFYKNYFFQFWFSNFHVWEDRVKYLLIIFCLYQDIFLQKCFFQFWFFNVWEDRVKYLSIISFSHHNKLSKSKFEKLALCAMNREQYRLESSHKYSVDSFWCRLNLKLAEVKSF